MRELYQELDRGDLITRLLPALQQNALYIRKEDKKITAQMNIQFMNDWIFSNPSEDNQCFFYRKIMFGFFKADFSGPPSWCQGCYKVVCKPKKVTDLFKIIDLQASEEFTAKAGIETRAYVHGLYGAYWYNRSLTEGKEKRRHVAKKIYGIDPDCKVFLKRGCTEMEQYWGDPNRWHADGRQMEWERLISEWVDVKEPKSENPEYFDNFTKKRFIEYAAAYGDSSYLELTGGRPLHMIYEPIKD